MLAPYLNYHRPYHFPTEYMDKKGWIRKRYRYQDVMTPYEKFRSLTNAESTLNSGTIFKQLDVITAQFCDNGAPNFSTRLETKLFQLMNKNQQPTA